MRESRFLLLHSQNIYFNTTQTHDQNYHKITTYTLHRVLEMTRASCTTTHVLWLQHSAEVASNTQQIFFFLKII